jgi:hypothetical protein
MLPGLCSEVLGNSEGETLSEGKPLGLVGDLDIEFWDYINEFC